MYMYAYVCIIHAHTCAHTHTETQEHTHNLYIGSSIAGLGRKAIVDVCLAISKQILLAYE